ncbi:MAG: GNAT family N-acetyltransferase [Gammaproteobacteria bacterium]|nr:GNAT family N-acetyltransferase [Gammaproteobacteria bacterium]
MLKSDNLHLRAPSQDIYDSLRKVKPCDEFYRMVGNDPTESLFVNDEKFNKSFLESLSRENYWHVFRGSEIIGVAFLHSLDAIDKRARYAVGIYNKENWNKGYGQELSKVVLNYAFIDLKLHRIDLRVLAYNKRAIASYKKSGFVQEGILRESAFINNEWHDDMIMGILSHEFSNE